MLREGRFTPLQQVLHEHISRDRIIIQTSLTTVFAENPQLRTLMPQLPSDDHLTNYRAFCTVPKESPRGESIAFIELPGAWDVAAQHAAELNGFCERSEQPVALAAALSSSASAETMEHSQNLDTRVAQQALLIAGLLQKYPSSEVYLLGHSLGGKELVYVVPKLQKALKALKVDTKIGGIILSHPASQYGYTMKEIGEFILKNIIPSDSAVQEIFPTYSDIAQAEWKRWEALEKSDTGLVLRWERQIQRLRQNQKQMPQLLLNEETQQKLILLDQKLETKLTRAEVRDLLKQRAKLLIPTISSLQKGLNDTTVSFVQSQAAFLFGLKMVGSEVFSSIPEAIRERIDCPVSIIVSHNDDLFPASRTEKERSIAGYKKRTLRYSHFPKAPLEVLATTLETTHNANVTNSSRYMSVVMDLVKRMQQHSTTDAQEFERRFY